MSAAAQRAPQRHRGEKPAIVPLPAWFLDSLSPAGYMVVPIDAIENLDRKLYPAARSVYINLLRLTVGNYRKNRPQKVRVTREDFAQWARVSPRQITNAITFLRESNVIGVEGDPSNGKYVLFWITDFTLSRLPEHTSSKADVTAHQYVFGPFAVHANLPCSTGPLSTLVFCRGFTYQGAILRAARAQP